MFVLSHVFDFAAQNREMNREIDQLLFPEVFGAHIIDMDLLFDDNDEDEHQFRVRRPYQMQFRATINSWDDFDFYGRFRMMKRTFLYVLDLVAQALRHPQPR